MDSEDDVIVLCFDSNVLAVSNGTRICLLNWEYPGQQKISLAIMTRDSVSHVSVNALHAVIQTPNHFEDEETT